MIFIWATAVTEHCGVDSQTVNHKGKITEPENSIDEHGFVFLGWFTTPSSREVTRWKFEEGEVTSDITLIAKWREIIYTRLFDNGAKTYYDVGDEFDLSKLTLEWCYNQKDEYSSDDPSPIQGTSIAGIPSEMVKEYDKYKSGDQTIDICFNGKITPFHITVASFDVALKSKPTKVNYTVGQALDLSGAKLTLES